MRAAEKESRVNVRWRRGPNVSQSERPAAATREALP